MVVNTSTLEEFWLECCVFINFTLINAFFRQHQLEEARKKRICTLIKKTTQLVKRKKIIGYFFGID